jgi:hypothetical protein
MSLYTEYANNRPIPKSTLSLDSIGAIKLITQGKIRKFYNDNIQALPMSHMTFYRILNGAKANEKYVEAIQNLVIKHRLGNLIQLNSDIAWLEQLIEVSYKMASAKDMSDVRACTANLLIFLKDKEAEIKMAMASVKEKISNNV